MDSLPVDKSPERIRRMFDAVASRYDLLNRLLSFGMDLRWRKSVARRLLHDQTLAGDVLDVCCGTGDLALAMQKTQKGERCERTIYGIDFSPEMIEIARRKAIRPLTDTVHFAVGDALNLPFEDCRFAVVAVAFGLRNLFDPLRGLAEMVRVCKLGGTVAVLDFSMPTLPFFRDCYRFYLCSVLPRWGEWVSRNQEQAYRYFAQSVMQFDQPGQLAEHLEQLGVGNVQVQPMAFGIVSLVWGEKV